MLKCGKMGLEREGPGVQAVGTLILFYFLAAPHGMWDLSSLTRN